MIIKAQFISQNVTINTKEIIDKKKTHCKYTYRLLK